MKIFSFKSLVSFNDRGIVVEDLALNHPYKRIGNELVANGYDEKTKWKYKIFFTLKGELKKICLERHSRSIAMLPWKEEFDVYELQKIKANGDIFSVVSKFITTSRVEHKFLSKVFCVVINGKEERKEFVLVNDKMTSSGSISLKQRQAWL